MSALNNISGPATLRVVESDPPTQPKSPQTDEGQTTPPPPYEDQLSYIEDMVLELKEMAASAGFEALSSILDIAHREAQLRRKETAGRDEGR